MPGRANSPGMLPRWGHPTASVGMPRPQGARERARLPWPRPADGHAPGTAGGCGRVDNPPRPVPAGARGLARPSAGGRRRIRPAPCRVGRWPPGPGLHGASGGSGLVGPVRPGHLRRDGGRQAGRGDRPARWSSPDLRARGGTGVRGRSGGRRAVAREPHRSRRALRRPLPPPGPEDRGGLPRPDVRPPPPSRGAQAATGTPEPSDGPGGRSPAVAPPTRACSAGWWPGWRGRGVPARCAGPHPLRERGWPRCA